jgi:cytochrome c-type biogenesis protein CcmE
MKPWVKFALLVTAIIGTLTWLAVGGINETKTYYKTISEVAAMGDKAYTERLRVGGDVEMNSIVRQGKEVRFILTQEKLRLPVVYRGTEPLPDTFRDGSQALADGKMLHNGTFEANKIQAKCASKYEGKPQYKVPATNPGAAAPNRAAL